MDKGMMAQRAKQAQRQIDSIDAIYPDKTDLYT